MKPMKLLKEAFVGTAIVIGMSSTAEAQKVTITYPNGEKREADCSKLYQENGQLWFTRETTEELDINHTPIGVSVKDLSKDEKEREKQLSNNLYLFLVHVARQHGDCVTMTMELEKKMGVKNVDEIYARIYEPKYGKDWKEKVKKNGCTVIDFTAQCKEAMDKKVSLLDSDALLGLEDLLTSYEQENLFIAQSAHDPRFELAI